MHNVNHTSYSLWSAIISGVPQGSILEPLIFPVKTKLLYCSKREFLTTRVYSVYNGTETLSHLKDLAIYFLIPFYFVKVVIFCIIHWYLS